jgi:8-oxo-dGTP diphosphatase
VKESTLCILVSGDPPERVLLGYKKTGFGQGKYTGFGGKVEPGEEIAAAAQREMLEESGVAVAPADLIFAARLSFVFPARPEWSQIVYVFLTWRWSGTPAESDEMAPEWFSPNDFPYASMWADEKHWLPPILAGRRIQAEFIYQADNERLAQFTISDLVPG